MNPQAKDLNEGLQGENSAVFSMLSEKGKSIFFPKKGILGQTADAKGKKIDATIGTANEDDGSPMHLKSLIKQVNLPAAKVFPYAPSYGNLDIRKQWQDMLSVKNPGLAGKKISLPVVTNALTHGLSMVGYMFLDSGDSVLVSDLFWGNYNLIFAEGCGAKIDKFNLFKDDKFDTESFASSIAKMEGDKKVIVLNFPNNPCGYTPTVEEVTEIVAVLKAEAEAGNKLVVVTDDAYFGLVYEEGIAKESIFAQLADLHENLLAVKADGPTKEDYVWGFRVGFITYGVKGGSDKLYDILAQKTAGAVRGNISNACNLSQQLLLESWTSATYEEEKQEKYNTLYSRFNKVKEVLAENPQYSDYFKALPFNSGYFMCVRLNDGLEGEKVRQILLDQYSTGVIALGDVLRLAFSAVPEKFIPELFENIYNACKNY